MIGGSRPRSGAGHGRSATAPEGEPHLEESQDLSAQANIVLVMADDMGVGDVGAFNTESLIPTPNIDRLARESFCFEDAHSSSAVCTPSRYSILTGRYGWRSQLKRGVLAGYEPPLIETSRMTLAKVLQKAGYKTGAFGKWHLGLGYSARRGAELDFGLPLPWREASRKFEERVDFARPVTGGPLELGFDEFFGTSGCPTCQPPYGFISGDRFLEPPRIYDDSPPYTGRPGMTSPGWRHQDADPTIIDEACRFITASAQAVGPFFAYVALGAPHEPCTNDVVPDFARGMSSAGPRGDLVWLVDYAVGKLQHVLQSTGIWHNTLFIVTSDNGALPGDWVIGTDGTEEYRTYGHRPSATWRGFKAHIREGGHRIPLIISWPGQVRGGARSTELVCLMDLFATISDVLGRSCPDDAEDSESFSSVLLGTGAKTGRPSLVHHSQQGVFALRLGNLKLVVGTEGSGGWAPPTGGAPVPGSRGQLYDLTEDPSESRNLWDERASLVQSLRAQLLTVVNGAADGYF
jgi:arylsulfatase A